MATPDNDPLQALETPGRIVRNPTSFDGSFPHGGTELGLVRDVAWQLVEVRQRIRAEELGQVVVGDLMAGEAFVLTFALRGQDDDAKAAIWPNTRVGAKSQKRILYGPGTVKAGHLAESTLACSLLFVPDNPEHDAVILPRAIPRRSDSPVFVEVGSEKLKLVSWLALPGANGLAYEVGPMVDFTSLT